MKKDAKLERVVLFPRLEAGRWDGGEAKPYLELMLAASLQATVIHNAVIPGWLVPLEDRPSNSSLTLLLERLLVQEEVTPRDLHTVYEVGFTTPNLEMQLWMRGQPGLIKPPSSWREIEIETVEEKN
jgi:hypothetical protein